MSNTAQREMQYTTAAEVAEWIESLAGQGFKRMELRPEKGGATIKVWPTVPEGDDVLRQAELAITRAQNRGHTARVAVAVFTLEATGPEDLRDSCEIVVAGAWSAGSEAPDMDPRERFLRDLMRNHLDMHRILIASDDTRARANERLIENLSAALDGHEKRRVLTFDLYERLVGHEFDRTLALKEAAQSEDRNKWLLGKLDLSSQILLNRLAGGGPGKGTPFFGEEMVKSLLKSLSPETCEVIMRDLKPEQAAVFAELYMAYASKEATKDKGAPINEGATNGHANGHANGNGVAGRKINGAPTNGEAS